jgi:hypothetical protein
MDGSPVWYAFRLECSVYYDEEVTLLWASIPKGRREMFVKHWMSSKGIANEGDIALHCRSS